MSNGKLFIGRKIRELRQARSLTQSQFAERVGISPSYLNQIENNQRSVSAAVLLAVARNFELDINDLSSGGHDRLVSALAEALNDPLFESHSPGLQELKIAAQNVPTFAHAFISLHQAYRRNSEQLASLNDTLGRSAVTTDPTPYEEVRDFFHFLDNYIHDLDTEAETLARRIGTEQGASPGLFAGFLESGFGVAIHRSPDQGEILRRYDPASKSLHLNALAPPATQDFQIALQIAQLRAGAMIDAIATNAYFRSEEAYDICRVGLQNYFAGALMMPYGAFQHVALDLRHDLELLALRFGTSLEQVCHRLSTLQRPGAKGIPIFFARIDRAGNITKRHSATKLQFARFGAACPLWNVHQAFEQPGEILRQLAETPDGQRYLSVAMQITKGAGGFHAKRQRFALALGCEITYARQFVYADGLDLSSRTSFDPIGISCRICERTHCAQRTAPPMKRKLVVNHNERGVLPYDIT